MRAPVIPLVLLLVARTSVIAADSPSSERHDRLARLDYGTPGLVVDLGVGLWAWPLPLDADGDGDFDLVVVCPDKPSNGTYLFENPGGDPRDPVFRPGVRLGSGGHNARVSSIDGRAIVLTPKMRHPRILEAGLAAGEPLTGSEAIELPAGKIRANQWTLVDHDGDGDHDLVVGIGHWTDYGWDDAYDGSGTWTRGPLHGWVYVATNVGADDAPRYDTPKRLEADGEVIDVYGWPSPCFADFDGDGDLDLVCGEFLDGFTYFRNDGTRTAPRYARGERLRSPSGAEIRMHLQMIVPSSVDWDRDGDVDLVVGQEDGRVAWLESTGTIDARGVPLFREPRFFRQEADGVKFGALATPVAVDWDGDGDQDVLSGNTAGEIAFIENLDGGEPPRLAPPVLLTTIEGGIRMQAGPNGSIQGPCEAKWGYTTIDAADWDADGRVDIVANGIWGRVVWYRRLAGGVLAGGRSIEVDWPGEPPRPEWNWWKPDGKELVTQWRTRPIVVDWTGDGLPDLVMLDHEGYLALFERSRDDAGVLRVAPGRRVFAGEDGAPLRLNEKRAGGSGRRKIDLVDWDGDGRLDLLTNSENADWWRNEGDRDGRTVFRRVGRISDVILAGHTTSPCEVDWNADGTPDLLLGAEDGFLYYQRSAPRARQPVGADPATTTGSVKRQ